MIYSIMIPKQSGPATKLMQELVLQPLQVPGNGVVTTAVAAPIGDHLGVIVTDIPTSIDAEAQTHFRLLPARLFFKPSWNVSMCIKEGA